MAPIRTGIIGYGLAGSVFHAPLLAVNPDYDVVAVVTGDPAKATDAQQLNPNAQVVATTAEAVALNLDLAVVATPNATHAPIAQDLLSAGVNVVIDKPFAVTSTEGYELVSHAAEAGLVITCYQNRRWDADFLTLQALLTSGELGQLQRFESRFERWRPEIKASWKEVPQAGSGIIYDLGPHLIDQALVLGGRVSHVHAEIHNLRPGAQVPDDVFLALTHESGLESHLSMSAVAGSPGPRFRALGSAGAYVKQGLDVQEARLRAGELPDGPDWGQEPANDFGSLCRGEEVTTVPSKPGNYEQFYVELALALRGEGAVPVDPIDSVHGLEIIERAVALSSQA